MRQIILSVLVRDRFGALSRVAILFGRRGCNIDAMTVDEAEIPNFTRITVTVSGQEEKLRQIYTQLRKVEDVAQVELITERPHLERSFALVRMKPGWEPGPQPEEIYTRVHRLENGGVMLEVLGETRAVKDLIRGLDPLYVDKIAGSGCTALSLGQ